MPKTDGLSTLARCDLCGVLRDATELDCQRVLLPFPSFSLPLRIRYCRDSEACVAGASHYVEDRFPDLLEVMTERHRAE